MFNHGLSTAALFLVTGIMISRRGSAKISDFGGVQKIAPILSGVLLVAGLSSLSLPGLAPFVSEFLVLAGTFTRLDPGRGLRDARHRAGGALHPDHVPTHHDRAAPARATKASPSCSRGRSRRSTPAIMLIIGLGFFPQPVLNAINPAIDTVVGHIGKGDPAPKTPAPITEVAESATQEGGH